MAQRQRPAPTSKSVGAPRSPRLARNSRRGRSCLDDENNCSEAPQGVWWTIRLGPHPRDVSRIGQDPEHKHRHQHRSRDSDLPRQARGHFRDLLFTLNRCVLAGVRHALIFARAFTAATGEALPSHVSVTCQLNLCPAVTITADHHSPDEQGIAEPEPDQEQPHDDRMESTSLHSEFVLRTP